MPKLTYTRNRHSGCYPYWWFVLAYVIVALFLYSAYLVAVFLT
jgi:hypothetical protein